jgi:hypothetical protein
MLPSLGARTPIITIAAAAGFVLIFIFGFLAWQSPTRLSFHSSSPAADKYGSSSIPGSAQSNMNRTASLGDKALASVTDIVQLLFADLKPAPDAPAIDDGNGGELKLPGPPRYKERLGKQVLILDLDTRPLESTEAFTKNKYDWRKINHVSGGVFNHYTYAQIHGYDYKFIQAKNFDDRHATWIKPSAIANELNKYKWIVFLDADATFRFLHLPIEWLLNYWDIQPKHSITMALDPWDAAEPQYNSDRFNRTYTNTGFMLVQKNAKTMEILKAWHECPEDTKYPECSQWKQPRFHEQSAFGEYIRYDYEDSIRELPCAEANGFPGVTVSNCEGKFIRHYWFDKGFVKKDFRENMMQAFTLPIQRIFAENKGNVVVQTDKNEIH